MQGSCLYLLYDLEPFLSFLILRGFTLPLLVNIAVVPLHADIFNVFFDGI
jgi:hypothetical protein